MKSCKQSRSLRVLKIPRSSKSPCKRPMATAGFSFLQRQIRMNKKYFISYRILGTHEYGRAEVTGEPICSMQDIEKIETGLEDAGAGGKDQGKVLVMSWQPFEESV